MKNTRPKLGKLTRVVWSVLAAGASQSPGAEPERSAAVLLPELRVFAQGRDDAALEVPAAVSAFDGGFLKEAGIHGYEALAGFVPGLFVQQQSPAAPSINIRGITTDSGDPRGETRAAIFQDGVSIGRSRASTVELFDLERVEVLKGPQGTLFGRGAQIGAISFVQNKAGPVRAASLAAGGDDAGGYFSEGMVNAPTPDGRLSARFAFRAVEREGYVDNVADGSTLQGRDTLAVRGVLRWLPGPDTTVDLIVNHQRDTPPATAFKSGVIPPSGGTTAPFTFAELNRGRELTVDRQVGGVTLLVSSRLNDAWTLTATGGWRAYDSHEDYDADGSRLPLLEFAEDARGEQFSQDVRLAYDKDGAFAGFVGAGYFRETGSQRIPVLIDERSMWPFFSGTFREGLIAAGVPAGLAGAAVPTLDPFAPVATLPAEFALFANPALPPSLQALAGLAGAPLQPLTTEAYTNHAKTEAWDAVADGTWRAHPRLAFTGGLRLTLEKITSGYEVTNAASPTTLSFLQGAYPNTVYAPTGGRIEASDTSVSLTGRVGMVVELSPAHSGYLVVARGVRPANLQIDQTGVTPLREEEVWSLEAGVKGVLAGGRLAWSSAVYQYDYRHFQTQVADPVNIGRFMAVDAGSATGRGLELAVQGSVTRNVSVFAGYGWTDVRYDETGDGGQVQRYAGNRTRLTARNTFTAGATILLPVDTGGTWHLSPIFKYKSGHYFDDDNAAYGGSLHQGGYSLVDMAAGWTSSGGRWAVTLRVENVFDKRYLIDAGNIGGSFGIPTFVAGPPRRFELSARLRF